MTGGIRLTITLVRHVLTVTVWLLHFTCALILTTAKSWYKDMRQWTHQHNVPTRRHKVVMPSLFILCEGSKSNPGDLLLCEGSKSNPEHSDILCWLVHQPPLSILFSTNNSSVPYPVCTAFALYFPFQPRERLVIQSLLLLPYYFLFESSPRFMLVQLYPLSSLFEPSPRFDCMK
jgi:hypothetical protein